MLGRSSDGCRCLAQDAAYLHGVFRRAYLEHDFADVHHLYARHGGAVRAQDVRSEAAAQDLRHVLGRILGCTVVPVLDVDVDEPAERRIQELPALFQVLEGHSLEVVLRYLADDGVVGVVRLQDDVSALVSAACAARYLRHHLE